ncbi:MAG: hypothetical protein JSU90_04845 [Nitrospiraceae bacterium]|nr:MAG: hypothetical protein JSU90_04845 [Nitrospiraceae bacterium]
MKIWREKMRPVYGVCLFVLILVSSCAATKLASTWKDSSYQGDIKRVFVIGAAQNPGMRRIFEREFATELKSHGLYAVPSHEYIPQDTMLDKDAIVSKVRELDMDTVLVTRLLDKKRIVQDIPGYYTSWPQYYKAGYQSSCPRGSRCDDVVALETNLYEVKTEKLVWSALTKTFIEDGTYQLIREFVQVIMENLMNEGLI